MSLFQEKLWKWSMSIALVSGILAVALALVVYHILDPSLNEVPIFNLEKQKCIDCSISIGLLSSIFMIATTLIIVIGFFRRLITERDDLSEVEKSVFQIRGFSNIFARMVLVLPSIFLALVGTILSFTFVDFLSEGKLTYPPNIAAIIVGAYVGVLAYFISSWALSFKTSDLNGIAIFVFVFGLLGSIISSSDPKWYLITVSRLGIDSASAIIFKVTFVMVAALLAAYVYEIRQFLLVLTTEDMDNKWPVKAPNLLCYGGLVAVVGLLLVAAFDEGIVHNIGAYLTVGIMVLAMLFGVAIPVIWPKLSNIKLWAGLKLVSPDYSKIFAQLSLALSLSIIVIFVFDFVDTYLPFGFFINFAGMELISLLVIAFWIYFFSVNTLSYIFREKIVSIEKIEENFPLHSDGHRGKQAQSKTSQTPAKLVSATSEAS